MNKMNGFALPTVMIASVVMLAVLLSGLVAASSINVSLRSQFNQRLLNEATNAGKVMAEECIKQNFTSWTALYPGGSCNPASNICPTVGAPNTCFVANNNFVRSTFVVKPLTTDAQGVRVADVEASLRTYRNSSVATNAPTRTETRTTKVKVTIKAWKDLALIGSGACGLSYESIVYCWGVSNGGQLGNGLIDGTSQPLPTAIKDSATGGPSGLRFQSISSGIDAANGYANVCGLTLNRQVWCWGRNSYGQHGIGTGVINNGVNPNPHGGYPARTVAGDNETNEYDEFLLGAYHACGLNTSYADGGQVGRIYCWGWNGLYQLGTGDTTHSTSAKMNGGWNYNKVIPGVHHTCGLAGGGTLWCWGLNANSAGVWSCTLLDTNPTNPAGVTWTCSDNGEARGTTPGSTNTGMTVNPYVYLGKRQVGTTADGICAIDTANELRCFGANFYGQAGNGVAIPTNGPPNPNINLASWGAPVTNTSGVIMKFKDMGIGNSPCALDMAGAAWCWGFGNFGGQGDGFTVNRSRAVRVITPAGGDGIYRRIYGGGDYSCGLAFDNKMWCWGRNASGNLGCATNYCTGGPVYVPQFSRDPPNSITY